MQSQFSRLEDLIGIQPDNLPSDGKIDLLDWSRLLLLKPQAVLMNLLQLELTTTLVAIVSDLDRDRWKGITTQWQIWPKSQPCMLRLDKDMVRNLLLGSLGPGTNDEDFNCHQTTKLERKILQTVLNVLRDHFELEIQTYEAQAELQRPGMAHVIWLCYSKHGFGRICLSLPWMHCPTLPPTEKQEIPPEDIGEEYLPVGLDVKLVAGSTRLKVSELKRIDVGDVILLQASSSETLRLSPMDIEIGLEVGERRPTKFCKWHKIDIDEQSLRQFKVMEELKHGSGDLSASNNFADFPVEVRAEFRNVNMTLRQLMNLRDGDFLPIDDLVEHQLVLTSQNKVIARGELVVAQDKLGVLIKEVLLKGGSSSTGSGI